MHLFEILKVLHLILIAAWLGPAFGAYWILITLGRELGPDLRLRLERRYEQVLRAEHVCFLLLLVSGVALIHVAGWGYLQEGWLQRKLVLVALIILIEIGDIVVSNILCQRLLRQQISVENPVWKRWDKLRFRFYCVTVPVLAVLIPWVMLIAVRRV